MNNILNFAEKAKKVYEILKEKQNCTEQNLANLLAFCVWSETMPCQQNLPETVTYINLFYCFGEFDLLKNEAPKNTLPQLYTNSLYAELLQNLQSVNNINSVFAINCIVCAKYFKNKNTKINENYLNILKKDTFFKNLFVEILKN